MSVSVHAVAIGRSTAVASPGSNIVRAVATPPSSNRGGLFEPPFVNKAHDTRHGDVPFLRRKFSQPNFRHRRDVPHVPPLHLVHPRPRDFCFLRVLFA